MLDNYIRVHLSENLSVNQDLSLNYFYMKSAITRLIIVLLVFCFFIGHFARYLKYIFDSIYENHNLIFIYLSWISYIYMIKRENLKLQNRFITISTMDSVGKVLCFYLSCETWKWSTAGGPSCSASRGLPRFFDFIATWTYFERAPSYLE